MSSNNAAGIAKNPIVEGAPSGAGGYLASNSAPSGGARSTNTESPLITVQPAKRSDLQPSYAQILEEDPNDVSTTGWYGSMSMHYGYSNHGL